MGYPNPNWKGTNSVSEMMTPRQCCSQFKARLRTWRAPGPCVEAIEMEFAVPGRPAEDLLPCGSGAGWAWAGQVSGALVRPSSAILIDRWEAVALKRWVACPGSKLEDRTERLGQVFWGDPSVHPLPACWSLHHLSWTSQQKRDIQELLPGFKGES